MKTDAPVGIDYDSIRTGLKNLPRASYHAPDADVDPDEVYTPASHRNALDPDRALVVGNRGMGKSFWAHALLKGPIRVRAAKHYGQPALRTTTAVIGFNASERPSEVAPSPDMLKQAIERDKVDPEDIWRAVLARVAAEVSGQVIPSHLTELAAWVAEDAERFGVLLSTGDKMLSARGEARLVIFDALDRLGQDWVSTRRLAKSLLRRTLASKSLRAIRLKLFMRPDQFADRALFDFPDASKIKNSRVDLEWPSTDLYGLLFHHLQRSSACEGAFKQVLDNAGASKPPDLQKHIVDTFAGEYMGAGGNRGRVYTWVPLHLADALEQTSPRTFLTAWREAAGYGAPVGQAVDHQGIAEGVRKASEDRLNELKEDYTWIGDVLEPLRGSMVPMERDDLERLWREAGTAQKLDEQAERSPLLLVSGQESKEGALVELLRTIGVVEVRPNTKINIPDIFRVEAGIKRKGGVKPPRRITRT